MTKSKRKKQNHRLHLIVLCLLLLNILLFGNILSIHAYFTDQDSITNTVTVGSNDIEITDGNQAIVKNTSEVSCYVRVFAEAEVAGTVTWSLNESVNTDGQAYWTNGGDGYYYYKNVLAPNELTEPLFTSLSVIGGGSNPAMIIYAESIQSIGFSSAENAFASNKN